MTYPTVRSRVAFLVLAVACMAAAIGARLWQLGGERSELLRARARDQHERRIEVWSRRGAILDRTGRELAVSVDSASLFAHPQRVPDPVKAARLLAPVIDVPQSRLLERLRADEPFVWLRRRLEPQAANAIRRLDLPVGRGESLDFKTEAKRYYPQGALGVHVVGFADIDQKGIEGIERTCDATLRGDTTGYIAVRDGRGAAVLQLVRPPATEARDVVLTLDLVLQHVVERELDRAMRETGAAWASAILLDPETGQVLAMANRPTADPNRYGEADPSTRRNRAVTDLYEPGSTFKVVTAAAALEHGRVYPEQRFHCGGGSLLIGGTRIRDSKPHASLTFREILERSSNVGMIHVAHTMPAERFREIITRFGFGEGTGIELPGESPGKLTPLSLWSGLTQASLAFGHEIAVTPLQMSTAFATLANGGVFVPPRIIIGSRDTSGALRRVEPPEPRRVVSESTARTLARMLEGVVIRGTGREAAVPGYRIAGKTGTAQKVIPGVGYSDTYFVASFGGFAPARKPRLAGLVVLDSPRGREHAGGAVAAPVFARIFADALTYLRVPPDNDPLLAGPSDRRATRAVYGQARRRVEPDTPAPALASRSSAQEGTVPDVRGLSMREALDRLARRGCATRAEGRGLVHLQWPAPGTPLKRDRICSILLSPALGGSP